MSKYSRDKLQIIFCYWNFLVLIHLHALVGLVETWNLIYALMICSPWGFKVFGSNMYF